MNPETSHKLFRRFIPADSQGRRERPIENLQSAGYGYIELDNPLFSCNQVIRYKVEAFVSNYVFILQDVCPGARFGSLKEMIKGVKEQIEINKETIESLDYRNGDDIDSYI